MESILSNQFDGAMRRLFKTSCFSCKADLWLPKHVILTKNYCSHKCQMDARKNRLSLECDFCKKSFERTPSDMNNSKSGLVFCSRDCKDKAQRLEGLPEIHPSHYRAERANKAQLIRMRGHRCESCGLTEWLGQPIPLEEDHVDGNAFNDDPANRRLLCPNCHAQTPTYRGRNLGHGRKARARSSAGERSDGIREAVGSIPTGSTNAPIAQR